MRKHALSDTSTLLTGTGIGAGLGALIGLADPKKRTTKRVLGFAGGGGAIGLALALYNLRAKANYSKEVKAIKGDQSKEALKYLSYAPMADSGIPVSMLTPSQRLYRNLRGLQTSYNNYKAFEGGMQQVNPDSPLLGQLGAMLTNSYTTDDDPEGLSAPDPKFDSDRVWFPRIVIDPNHGEEMCMWYDDSPVGDSKRNIWDKIYLRPSSSLGIGAHEVNHGLGYLNGTVSDNIVAEEARATEGAMTWLRNLPSRHPKRLDQARESIADLLTCFGTYELPVDEKKVWNNYGPASDFLSDLGVTESWLNDYLQRSSDAKNTPGQFTGIWEHWQSDNKIYPVLNKLLNIDPGVDYKDDDVLVDSKRSRVPRRRTVDSVDDKQYKKTFDSLIDWFGNKKREYNGDY